MQIFDCSEVKYWHFYVDLIYSLKNTPLGLPGGLRARIPLFATFIKGRKLHSCSPPNDFKKENSSFSPLPIRSLTLSPKS